MIRDDSALPHLHQLHHAAGRLPLSSLAAGRWPLSSLDSALHAPTLVLFVGAAVRPDQDAAELLAQSGLRCVAVADLDGAHTACGNLQFDALVIDSALLQPTLALGLAGLHLAAGAPMVVAAPRASEIDEIIALEHGASHYLVRPLSPRLLRAHLMALLRPRQPVAEALGQAAAGTEPGLAGWVLDPLQRLLCRGEHRIELTEGQFSLLQALAAQAGRVVPRGELEARVAGDGALTARAIDVYVHRLRKRLAELGAEGLEIESVRGLGYRLRCRASEAALAA
jgi:two-component system OmpR family response regulator